MPGRPGGYPGDSLAGADRGGAGPEHGTTRRHSRPHGETACRSGGGSTTCPVAIWDDTVGPAVARNAQPERSATAPCSQGTGATWDAATPIHEGSLDGEAQQRLEAQVVTNIFFVVGNPAERRRRAPIPSSGGRNPSRGRVGPPSAIRAPGLAATVVAEPSGNGLGACPRILMSSERVLRLRSPRLATRGRTEKCDYNRSS